MMIYYSIILFIMREVKLNEMVHGKEYFIELRNPTRMREIGGSGRQKGIFDRLHGNSAVFSIISNITHTDGTIGHSGMNTGPGERGSRGCIFFESTITAIENRSLKRFHLATTIDEGTNSSVGSQISKSKHARYFGGKKKSRKKNKLKKLKNTSKKIIRRKFFGSKKSTESLTYTTPMGAPIIATKSL
jgi:hypothetical protein